MAFESQRDNRNVTKISNPIDLTTIQEQIATTQRKMQQMITNINTYANTNIKGLEKLSLSSLENLNNKVATLSSSITTDMQDLLSNFSNNLLTKQIENNKEVYKLNASMIAQLAQLEQDSETKLTTQKLKSLNDVFEQNQNLTQRELNETLQNIEKIKLEKNTTLMMNPQADVSQFDAQIKQEVEKVSQLKVKLQVEDVDKQVQIQNIQEREQLETNAIQKIIEMKRQGINIVDEEALKNQLVYQEEQKKIKENQKLKRKMMVEYNIAQYNLTTKQAKQENKTLQDLKKQRKEAKKSGDTTKVAQLDTQIEQQETVVKDLQKESSDYLAEAFSSKMETIFDDFADTLNKTIDTTLKTYNQYQQKINVRLQGTNTSWNGILGYGGIESTIKSLVGINPYVSLQKIFDNVVTATESGIAFDIEQRAFLQTMKDSIASTFDAFNSNLTQLIRNQQADTTAARLGMEASLTKYYNAMFSDSSYLNEAFDSVSANLYEALTQVTASDSVAIEYQVQKWLGSLYSVGFSANAVSQISQALGQLGSGNISGLSNNSTMQNLLVMAMSRAGLSYSDFLTQGLTAENTNLLMQSMVQYLSEISQSTNQVVKSEYASMFGMTVSDLSAVQNISSDISTIAQSSLSYTGAMQELSSQMSVSNLYERLGISGMLDNLSSNAQYSMASSVASNPVLYLLYKAANTLEEVADGIDIPAISVFGNMVDLETDVSTLMKAGVLGMGAVSTMISAISGLTSSIAPSSMLTKLGISTSKINTTSRGKTYQSSASGGENTSMSNYVVQGSGSDIKQSLVTQAQGSGQEQLDVKKEEEVSKTSDDIYNIVNSLYQLFDSVKSGNALNVIASYDRTGF